MSSLRYYHLDVFASRPFTGNSLTVFADASSLSTAQMLTITRELRHFESIFLTPTDAPHTYRARIFDLIEELDFAGHPVLGAASVLHRLSESDREATWNIELNAKTVTVTTLRAANGYSALLDQGKPEYLGAVPEALVERFAQALNLNPTDLPREFPPEVVSTGLRYLILPIARGLDRARISCTQFDALLATVGAQFVYVLDVDALEGRHWNNDGLIEDVATGSAAGAAGAYLARRGRVEVNKEFVLRQGRFTGRPSEMYVTALGTGDAVENVRVGGDVSFVGQGTLESAP